MSLYEYAYDAQFERAMSQFMRVFSGFQVRDKADRGSGLVTKRVPVIYSKMDRVVADAVQRRGYFKSATLPVIGIHFVGATKNTEEDAPKNHMDSFGTELTASSRIDRIIGPSFIVSMNVTLYASSSEELFQILEQILLIFNPKVTINVDDTLTNADYLSEITLTNMSDETQAELGSESQAAMMTLDFDFPFRLKYKHDIREGIIQEIIKNVKDLQTDELIFTETIT